MASGFAVNRRRAGDDDGHAGEIPAAVEFRVDVAQEHDAVRISPAGEVDLATVGRVRARVDEALAAAARLILDLRATTFADSSVLHLAVKTQERAARDEIPFAIIPGPPVVQRTFEVAGLSDRLPFVDVPRA
jgi:anti-anti-sigma factor